MASQDARFSIAKPLGAFDTNFSLNQGVHILRKKLHNAHCILENTAKTIALIDSHAQKLGQMKQFSSVQIDSFRADLDNISSDVHSYISTTRKLLRFSEDLRLLVFILFPLKPQVRCIGINFGFLS